MSWRFLLHPKWLVRHVAVALLVTATCWLGFWQLGRLDEKRAYRDLVEARQQQPAVAVEALLDAGEPPGSPAVADVLYRSVAATGTYQDADTVIVDNRTLNGASGGWVLTPLLLADGTAVVVNRGFVGFDRTGALVAPAAPPGVVQVTGLLFPSQRRGGIGPTDPTEGTLDVLARADLGRIAAQVPYDVLPAYVQRVASDPPESTTGVSADAAPLVALGPPDPTEGPHLSYAVQWFTFMTIAAVGYGLLLRRVARDEGLIIRR